MVRVPATVRVVPVVPLPPRTLPPVEGLIPEAAVPSPLLVLDPPALPHAATPVAGLQCATTDCCPARVAVVTGENSRAAADLVEHATTGDGVSDGESVTAIEGQCCIIDHRTCSCSERAACSASTYLQSTTADGCRADKSVCAAQYFCTGADFFDLNDACSCIDNAGIGAARVAVAEPERGGRATETVFNDIAGPGKRADIQGDVAMDIESAAVHQQRGRCRSKRAGAEQLERSGRDRCAAGVGATRAGED